MFKGHQSYGPSKLAVKKNSRPFGFEATFYVVVHGRILAKIKVLKVHKLWALTAPIPLAQNECLVLHLKDPIHICWEPEAQKRGMTFRAIFLVRITNVNIDTRMDHVQMSMHVNNREIGSQNRVSMVNVASSLNEF